MAHINRERLVGGQADRCGAHWQGFSITKAANVLTGAGWMHKLCNSIHEGPCSVSSSALWAQQQLFRNIAQMLIWASFSIATQFGRRFSRMHSCTVCRVGKDKNKK